MAHILVPAAAFGGFALLAHWRLCDKTRYEYGGQMVDGCSMGTNLSTRQLTAVTCRAEIRALRPSATAAVGRAPRVACHGLQLHARSAIVPKTGCRDIGPRLTLKSGSVEAAIFLLRHASRQTGRGNATRDGTQGGRVAVPEVLLGGVQLPCRQIGPH